MSQPSKILFIGNSYTTRNDMPSLLKQIASNAGAMIETEVVAFGGASLAMHWKKGVAASALTRQRWDAVVLQDQSTRPLRALKSMQQYGRSFIEAVHAAGSHAFLYLTWARADRLETQDAISIAYQDLARETGARVVPVGIVWQRALQQNSNLQLHDSDLSHPSLTGSYLAACTFYVSLFGKKPPSSDIAGLDHGDAVAIEELAWRMAQP